MGQTIFCPKCGAQSKGEKFCRSCGTNLAVVGERLAQSESRNRVITARGGGQTTAFFTGGKVSNEGRDLDGHSALTIFGAITVDLKAETLPLGETKISISSIFGTGTVHVPNDVAVRVTGTNLFSTLKVRDESIHTGTSNPIEYISPGYEQALRRLHIDMLSIFSTLMVGK